MVFENGVKNKQAAAYNGARTVYRKRMPLNEDKCVSFTKGLDWKKPKRPFNNLQ